MPHYSDGTIAKLGDTVKGKTYNIPHEVVGVVVGIIADSESCNVRVAFLKPAIWPINPIDRPSIQFERLCLLSGYDGEGRVQAVKVEVDYGETKALTKIA